MPRSTTLDSGWELAAPRWLAPPGKLGHTTLEWLAASVPGHVHDDLLKAGVLLDPFVGLGELGCQWVDEEDWSYRCRFQFESDPALPRRVLRFEGLDTVCVVSLDGEKLAAHDNMFVPLEIDVSDRLATGPHELRVDFASAARVGRERRTRYLAQEGIPDSVTRFEERAFVRKAQYMFGWDWGPRIASVGIWRPVRLIEHAGRIGDVQVRQTHGSDGSVELEFASQVEGSGSVLHRVEGFSQSMLDGETLRIERPELWWPASLGPQRLYRVESLLVSELGPDRGYHAEQVLDRRSTPIGLARVRLVREPDDAGESFEFEVNGKRIWAVGANWICNHALPSRVSRAELRAQLLRARDLNMNMLRVWGGGLYESDDFYDLCDELGLMVWQDFAYACSYYPEDDPACAVAREEAAVNVRRLRHHPSLVLWCGNNENAAMFHDLWGARAQHPPRYYGERLYHDVLPEVLAELDPGRPYWPSSPWGGESPGGGGSGDQHYWDVWHGRGDWVHYDDSTARFASEFGFCAAPGLAAWRRMMPEERELDAVDVGHPTARWHDKTGKGYGTFLGLVELHYPPARNLEEWIYYSQLNQRDALRYGIEHYRRSEFCKGALIWQLNDCWPAQSWAVVDSAGEYKAAAYELRRLFAPALVSLERRANVLIVHVILDNADEPVRGPVVVEACSLMDGAERGRWEANVELQPGERKVAIKIELGVLEGTTTLLSARFAGWSTHRLLTEPKHVQAPCGELRARMTAAGLELESPSPVVDLCLYDSGGELRLLDNCVTLAQPGRIVLRGAGRVGRLVARSLGGRHPVKLTGS